MLPELEAPLVALRREASDYEGSALHRALHREIDGEVRFDRGTRGGMLGNNSCGVHSLFSEFYGPGPRTSDHVEELDVVTYDGCRVRARATDAHELRRVHDLGGRVGAIYDRLLALRDRYA